jgi:hypothetical protein
VRPSRLETAIQSKFDCSAAFHPEPAESIEGAGAGISFVRLERLSVSSMLKLSAERIFPSRERLFHGDDKD